MDKVTFSFGSIQSSQRPNQNVVMTINDSEDEDFTCEVETQPQSISSFNGTFRKPEAAPKFIVIPASPAAIDESKPMLLRNRPDGLAEIIDEKEKYLHDVAARAEDNTMENYNKVDVSKFGEGILRGLGWTPGSAVGKSNKGVTEVIALIARPERLGLGAKPKPAPVEKLTGKHVRPGEQKQYYEAPRSIDGKVRHYRTLDEELKVVKKPFYDGCQVFIISGIHKGVKGRVLNSENSFAKIVLPSDEIVKISFLDMEQLDDLDVIRRREYEAKEENEKREAEKERKKAQRKEDEERRKEKGREREKVKRERKETNKEKKRERDSKNDDKYNSKKQKSDSKNSKPITISSSDDDIENWIRTRIRVKIVSKEFQNGKYYCKAGWIVDLLSNGRCSILLDDTNILVEGFKQSDIESVVPPAGGHVIVLRGEHKGERGVILEKDSKRDRVQVQLEEDFEIVSLRLDDVAQRK